MTETGIGGSLRYAGLYALKLALAAVLIGILCWYLLHVYTDSLPSDAAVDRSGVILSIMGHMPILIPTLLLALVAGYFDAASPKRLAARLALNAYLVFAVFFLTSEVSYTLESVTLTDDPVEVTATMTLAVDISAFGYMLLPIPACSAIDAVLDYRRGRSDR